jgi:hypothetical protein
VDEGCSTAKTWVGDDGTHHHAVLLSHQTPKGFRSPASRSCARLRRLGSGTQMRWQLA